MILQVNFIQSIDDIILKQFLKHFICSSFKAKAESLQQEVLKEKQNIDIIESSKPEAEREAIIIKEDIGLVESKKPKIPEIKLANDALQNSKREAKRKELVAAREKLAKARKALDVALVQKEKNVTSNKGTKEMKKPARKVKRGNKRKKKLNSNTNHKHTQLLPLSALKLGSHVDGHVASFTKFGAFIKIGYNLKGKGKEGHALLHKSQISDHRVEDVSNLFRIGDLVQGLRVIQIDYKKGEVGLSLRKRRPTRTDLKDITIGSEMTGKVANVVSYGAFVDVGASVKALVHISRISQDIIQNIRHYVNEGDEVRIHIISKDEKKKTLGASMLGVDADEYLDGWTEKSTKDRKKHDSVKKIVK